MYDPIEAFLKKLKEEDRLIPEEVLLSNVPIKQSVIYANYTYSFAEHSFDYIVAK